MWDYCHHLCVGINFRVRLLCIECFFSLQGRALMLWPPFTTNHLVTLSPSTVCIRRSATLRRRKGELKSKTSWRRWVKPSHLLLLRLSPRLSPSLPQSVDPFWTAAYSKSSTGSGCVFLFPKQPNSLTYSRHNKYWIFLYHRCTWMLSTL